MREKRGFWLFVTSCLTGCGQMYQGYMKRGLSLLMLFFSLLAVAGFLRIAPIAFFLPVVWAYAFFDSYNLRSRIAAGAPQEDEYLFGFSEMDSLRMSELLRKRHSFIGWVLVALGLYMLYDTFMRRLAEVFYNIHGLEWVYGLLVYDLPRLVMTVLVILLGLWFIRGPRASRSSEEIPSFTPPAQKPEAPFQDAVTMEPVSEDAGAGDTAAEVAAVVNSTTEDRKDGE